MAYAAAHRGLRPPIPSYCPAEYAELMQQCWAHEPDDRPNFQVILRRLFELKKESAAAQQNIQRNTAAMPVLEPMLQAAAHSPRKHPATSPQNPLPPFRAPPQQQAAAGHESIQSTSVPGRSASFQDSPVNLPLSRVHDARHVPMMHTAEQAVAEWDGDVVSEDESERIR